MMEGSGAPGRPGRLRKTLCKLTNQIQSSHTLFEGSGGSGRLWKALELIRHRASIKREGAGNFCQSSLQSIR